MLGASQIHTELVVMERVMTWNANEYEDKMNVDVEVEVEVEVGVDVDVNVNVEVDVSMSVSVLVLLEWRRIQEGDGQMAVADCRTWDLEPLERGIACLRMYNIYKDQRATGEMKTMH
jgi:hypothetical protein